VHYEATRARLDPQLVLGLIEVESGLSQVRGVEGRGARYMQVMPFWLDQIGQPGHNLFHLRTNTAYGCAILRHYLDVETAITSARWGATTAAWDARNIRTWGARSLQGRWKYDGPTA